MPPTWESVLQLSSLRSHPARLLEGKHWSGGTWAHRRHSCGTARVRLAEAMRSPQAVVGWDLPSGAAGQAAAGSPCCARRSSHDNPLHPLYAAIYVGAPGLPPQHVRPCSAHAVFRS
jgi:hypothetical protein